MICRLNTEIEDPRLRLEAIVADFGKVEGANQSL